MHIKCTVLIKWLDSISKLSKAKSFMDKMQPLNSHPLKNITKITSFLNASLIKIRILFYVLGPGIDENNVWAFPIFCVILSYIS